MIFSDLVDFSAEKSFFIIKTECEQGGKFSSLAAPDASPSGSVDFCEDFPLSANRKRTNAQLYQTHEREPSARGGGREVALSRKRCGAQPRDVALWAMMFFAARKVMLCPADTVKKDSKSPCKIPSGLRPSVLPASGQNFDDASPHRGS